MENWKKFLVRAVGFGAGFAVITAVIVVFVLWWSSHPPRPKPWDDRAIAASYESLDTEGDANTFRFVYTLQNNTDADYRIETDSGVHLAAFLKRSQALSSSDTQNLHTDFPIYIPAMTGPLVPFTGQYDKLVDDRSPFSVTLSRRVSDGL